LTCQLGTMCIIYILSQIRAWRYFNIKTETMEKNVEMVQYRAQRQNTKIEHIPCDHEIQPPSGGGPIFIVVIELPSLLPGVRTWNNRFRFPLFSPWPSDDTLFSSSVTIQRSCTAGILISTSSFNDSVPWEAYIAPGSSPISMNAKMSDLGLFELSPKTTCFGNRICFS
jgi:hypothetical protein